MNIAPVSSLSAEATTFLIVLHRMLMRTLMVGLWLGAQRLPRKKMPDVWLRGFGKTRYAASDSI